MDVNFAFIADYADNSGGKITAVGLGIDTVYAKSVPARHPLMFAVISIKFSITEIGQKRIGMCLIDQDGHNVIPTLDTIVNVTSPPSGFLYKNHNIVLAMNMIEFPDYGDYSISWLLEGQEIKSIPLKVSIPPTQPTTE
ncbi:DUF6941 family protein [Chloroflexota bacterium]